MSKTDIKYISLLAPLFYLYGTIFLWTKNAQMFRLEQFVYSFMVILTVAIVLYFLVYVLLNGIYKKIQNNKKLRIGISLFLAILTGLIGNFCFFKVIFFPYHHAVMYGTMIGIFFIIYYNMVKKIIFFLVVLFILTFGFNGYNLYPLYKMQQNFYSKSSGSDNEYLVKFKNKPNIYLFWLESFHGTRTLKNFYHTDVTSLINYLNEQNFSVCENMYSSSPDTLRSMVDLYSLGHIPTYMYIAGNVDVGMPIRKLISGENGNTFLKVLKYNNYTTNIIIDDVYYFSQKGTYLDYCQYLERDNLKQLLLPSYFFTKLNKKINRKKINRNLTLKEQIEAQLHKMKKENKPYFLAWKGGVFHTDPFGSYSYRNIEEWIKSNRYQKAIEQNQREIVEIINMIIENDNNALIVMLGDHGAWAYRGLRLNELSKNKVTITDFIDDKYNVFGAVRLPEKYKKFSFENSDTYINHSNIFVHIFSLLAEDPNYLKLQNVPVSYWENNPVPVIKNGKIINELQ